MSLQVDLAICTYGRGDAAVEGLRKSSKELSIFSRVLVVDNNPTGLSPEICAELRSFGAEIVAEPSTGLSKARNRALKESQSEYVWFIDDDASLVAGFAAHAKRHFDRIATLPAELRPVFGGGLILAASQECDVSTIGAFERGMLSCMRPDEHFVQPWGANMLAHRQIALSVGGFDPQLGWVKESGALLGEEDDLFLRMSKCVVPERRKIYFFDGCAVDHWIPAARRNLGWLLRRAFKGGRSNFIVYRALTWEELWAAVRNLLRSPSRDNLLRVAFVVGKAYQRFFKQPRVIGEAQPA